MTNQLIVLEGMDGCGKGTQIELLRRDFPQIVFTREPGGSEIGEEIRSLIFKYDHGPWADFFLHFAQRTHHLQRIRRLLEEGRRVISDRSDASTYAFQICGENCLQLRDLFFETRSLVYDQYLEGLSQPHYIVLDLEASESKERVDNANRENQEDTHYDARPLDYYERVRNGYLELANLFPDTFSLVDASRSREEVYRDVKRVVES